MRFGTTAEDGKPGHHPLMRKLARCRRANVAAKKVTTLSPAGEKAVDQTYDEDARLDTDDVDDVKILVEVIVGALHDHYGARPPFVPCSSAAWLLIVFVVRAAAEAMAGDTNFYVPIGKPHGMADRKAALGRVDKRAVTFDELTLTAYDEEGNVIRAPPRTAPSARDSAAYRRDQHEHFLPPGMAPHELVRAQCAEGDTFAPQLVIDCVALSQLGGADSEAVTNAIAVTRRVMEEIPSFQIMRCEGWRPGDAVMERYRQAAAQVETAEVNESA